MVLCYLSGPIIHNHLRKDNFYQLVIDTLKDLNIEVFAPQFLQSADPGEVFQRDVTQVRACDFLIAEVSNPSLGVGMEIMLTIELSKPVLMFRHTESKPLSFMARGAPGTVLFEYTQLDEVETVLNRIDIPKLRVRKCGKCSSDVSEIQTNRSRCIRCGHTRQEPPEE
ncbi:MAG: nucleoside 2-deoxyribosyltransferase [Candidatus Thorarchaeota archaeon]